MAGPGHREPHRDRTGCGSRHPRPRRARQGPAPRHDPAALLLDRAALLTAARRGGRRPAGPSLRPRPSLTTAPAVSRAAGRRLARMLGGEHADLLAEWLAAAAGAAAGFPPGCCPRCCTRPGGVCPADSGLRRLVAAAGGSRARWLAGLNPDGVRPGYAPAGEDAWRLGSRPAARYLSALRARDLAPPGTWSRRAGRRPGRARHVPQRDRGRAEPGRRAPARRRARRPSRLGAQGGRRPARRAARDQPWPSGWPTGPASACTCSWARAATA